MSEAHLSSDDLAAFAAKRLEAPRVQAVFAHLSSCPHCRSTWQQAMDTGRSAERVRDDLVREHAPHIRRRRVMVQALAAVLAIAVIGVLLLVTLRKPAPSVVPEVVQTTPRTETVVEPPPSQPTPAPQPIDPVIARALERGVLPPPASLAALLAAPAWEPTRGSEGTTDATYVPDREVVATPRPRFHFPAERGFPTVVRVFDRNREVLTSEPVDSGEWTPPTDLPRGVTYTWQVESTRDGETVVGPAPPAPPARFVVVDENAWRALETARREQPENHLLLGILSARAGLREEAERELRRASEAGDPRVAALLRSVRNWPR